MQRSVRPPVIDQEKLQRIKTGEQVKTQKGVKENKNIIQGKGTKYHVTQKEEKFEEAGVKRKKRNYVMYESKLGTEKSTDFRKIMEAPKLKPKPKPVEVQPRQEEKIVQKRKRIEYLDNYQYHETKDIKNPNTSKLSIVTHQRLGDIIGGSFEETTYQRTVMTDPGRGEPKQYSQQTAKTTLRRNAAGQPTTKTTTTTMKRSNTADRTLPLRQREVRKEVNQYSSNTATRAPKKNQIPTRNVKNPRETRTFDRTGSKSDNEYTRIRKITTTTTNRQATTTQRRRK